MGGRIGIHGANDAQVVGPFGRVGEEAADLQAAPAVLAEGKGALHQVADGPVVGTDLQGALVGSPVKTGQSRLGIEGVHLAGSSVHEEKHGMLGLGREMRRLGGQQGTGPWEVVRSGRGPGEEAVATQKVGEGQACEAAPHLPQELPPAAGGGVGNKPIGHGLTSRRFERPGGPG